MLLATDPGAAIKFANSSSREYPLRYKSHNISGSSRPAGHLAGAISKYLATGVCGLLLVTATAGCNTAQVSRTVVADLNADDQDTQIEFWHTLATKPICANDDAMHAILLDQDGTDPNPDYPARVKALKARKLLLASFNRPANEAVTRGTIAVALYQAAGLKGGVILHLFGP